MKKAKEKQRETQKTYTKMPFLGGKTVFSSRSKDKETKKKSPKKQKQNKTKTNKLRRV